MSWRFFFFLFCSVFYLLSFFGEKMLTLLMIRAVLLSELGHRASTLIEYLERNGAAPIPPGANPAQWMLKVIGRQEKADAGEKIDRHES